MRTLATITLTLTVAACANLEVEESASIQNRDKGRVVQVEEIEVEGESRSKRAALGALAAITNPVAIIPTAIIAGAAVEDDFGKNTRFKTVFEIRGKGRQEYTISRKFDKGSCVTILERTNQPPLIALNSNTSC